MNVNELMQKATEAANTAGDEWMQNARVQFVVADGNSVVGSLLDVCGNSHIKFADRRTKAYKAFKQEGFVHTTGTIHVPHKYVHRQEYGLHQACTAAAMQVLLGHGVEKLKLWSYVD